MKTTVLKNYAELIHYTSMTSPEEGLCYRLSQDFVNLLTKFCDEEIIIFNTYRVLKEIERDVLKRKFVITVPNNQSIFNLYDNIQGVLSTEIEILNFKISNPSLLQLTYRDHNVPELLKWTDPKVHLVELIYAIAKSINDGKASLKKIVNCFEYFFQIDLGNVYDTLDDINLRKKDSTTKYLNSLIKNFQAILDELNNR